MTQTLVVTSLRQTRFPSKTSFERTWSSFMNLGGSNHSGRANLLPYIINRCEREGIPYTLKAVPGQGYWIGPSPEIAEAVVKKAVVKKAGSE